MAINAGITKSSLARMGVELVDRGTLHLRCSCCGHEWRIRQGADIRRPNHYRVCRVCHPWVNRANRRHRRRFHHPFHVLRPFQHVA